MARHLDWGKCDWFHPKSSVLRKVYQGSEHATVAMGVLAPGHLPVPHRHRYEQLCAIVKGKCDFHPQAHGRSGGEPGKALRDRRIESSGPF